MKSVVMEKGNILHLVPPISECIVLYIFEIRRSIHGTITVLFIGNHPSITPKHLENVNYVVSGAAPIGSLDVERLIQK